MTMLGFNQEASGTLNSMTTAGKSYYYLTDALGSVLALADETGAKVNEYRYSPCGVDGTFTEKASQSCWFAVGYQDPTGLYHLNAQYYDPRIGRFTNPGSSGQEKNPYLCAEGGPVNRNDPNGLLSFGGIFDKAGKILDDGNDTWGAATNCIAGIDTAAETGIITTASTFGPWSTGAAIAGR